MDELPSDVEMHRTTIGDAPPIGVRVNIIDEPRPGYTVSSYGPWRVFRVERDPENDDLVKVYFRLVR